MTERTLETLRDAMLARLSESYDLIYVDYRDGLTDEQAQSLIAGDAESLYESMDTWLSDASYDGARYELDELRREVIAEWEREDDEDYTVLADEFVHSDEEDEVRWVIQDRDGSNPIRDLAGQTRPQYIRVRIGEDFVLAGEDMDEDVETVMANADLPDAPEVRALVRSIIPEAGTGRHLTPFLFASVDMREVYDLPLDREAEVTITGGSLLLEDGWNGAGWNDDLPEGFQITVKRGDLRHDEDAWGYSWNDVCGLVTGAWPASLAPVGKCEVTA